MRGTTSRYSLVWQCLSPFDIHCPAAALSGAAGGRRNIGCAMPLQTVDMYQFANDWSVWAAGIIAVSIFVLVLRLSLRLLPNFDLNFDWKRKPKSPKRIAAKRVAPPVARQTTASDIDWQRVTRLLEARMGGMESIGASRDRAAQGIEAAEYMLSGVLADCAAVMLTAEARDHMRSRRTALSAVPGAEPTSVPAASVAA
jgi:hypothetical protein